MKLQAKLGLGLAVALFGAPNSTVAQQVSPSYYGLTAPVEASAPANRYGYVAPQAAAAPQLTAASGYPLAPVQVAQAGSGTKDAGSASRPVIAAPASVNHIAAPQAAVSAPAHESWGGYVAPGTADCGGSVCDGSGSCGDACGAGGLGHNLGQNLGSNLGLVNFASSAPSRQWFFGLYGLYLDRYDAGSRQIAVALPDTPAGPTFPQQGVDRFLATGDVDFDARGGAEIRFGSTFGSAYDACTGDCYQPFAWELAYWAISDDPDQALLVDEGGLATGTERIYGQLDYSGLVLNGRTLNDYFDFQNPPGSNPTNDIRVLAARVRTNFEAQNLELNLWRFGSPFELTAAHGGHAGCADGACGYDTCGSCASGSCGAGSCGAGGCSTRAPKRFFISGLAGFRYFRTDESLQNAVFFNNPTDPAHVDQYPGAFSEADPQAIFDGLEIDNELVGFQIGCSINRLVGCRWSLFCDSNFGVYNNSVSQFRAIFTAAGDVTYQNGGNIAVIQSSDDALAFLGEARCGVAYQVSQRCRLTAAWRAVALSGVATAEGQLDQDFTSLQASQEIDTDGSIILHGLQAGAEFKF